MTEETQISTPENDTDVMTSTDEPENTSDTSDVEVTEDVNTAEVETGATNEGEGGQPPEEPKLYAGKYKSIEELEKGYQEAQKTLTQNSQLKKKYDELVRKQEFQEAKLLESAKQQGFQTINDQKIAQQVAQAEFNEFVNSLNYLVDADSQITVQQCLNAYRQTGDTRYLNEAKRYYPSDFLENVAVGKLNMKQRLTEQFDKENREKLQKADEELAQVLKTDYGDFLETIKANKGASKALELFCNAGFIKSAQDMDAFKGIYDDIIASAKEQAIKEYEAQKVIESTKNKAVINSDGKQTGLNTKRTMNDIANMTQKEFDDYCAKYGTDWIYAQ